MNLFARTFLFIIFTALLSTQGMAKEANPKQEEPKASKYPQLVCRFNRIDGNEWRDIPDLYEAKIDKEWNISVNTFSKEVKEDSDRKQPHRIEINRISGDATYTIVHLYEKSPYATYSHGRGSCEKGTLDSARKF